MTTTNGSSAPNDQTSGKRPRRKLLKPVLWMIALVVLLVAVIGGTKALQISKLIAQSKIAPPPVVVTALTARYAQWQPEIAAVGSAKAVRGVDVTTEVGGIVRSVAFKPGQEIASGAVLVALNDDDAVANLRALKASAGLAETTVKRDRAQRAVDAVSQAQVDADEADLESKRAQVAQQAALVAKKTIRAPFAGRIGITSVNPGQYLNPGDKIASLQTLDPIYVDFNISQDQLPALTLGQAVSITAAGLPRVSFPGTVTAVDSRFDQTTRNVTVEATVRNPRKQLLAGMFTHVAVASGARQRYLTIPQTAVTYNPYGTTVFIAAKQKDAAGHEVLTAQQKFVKTGPTRGDQVAILSGINEGDVVITSGQLKLKGGAAVRVDNHIAPLNAVAPTPQEQ